MKNDLTGIVWLPMPMPIIRLDHGSMTQHITPARRQSTMGSVTWFSWTRKHINRRRFGPGRRGKSPFSSICERMGVPYKTVHMVGSPYNLTYMVDWTISPHKIKSLILLALLCSVASASFIKRMYSFFILIFSHRWLQWLCPLISLQRLSSPKLHIWFCSITIHCREFLKWRSFLQAACDAHSVPSLRHKTPFVHDGGVVLIGCIACPEHVSNGATVPAVHGPQALFISVKIS